MSLSMSWGLGQAHPSLDLFLILGPRAAQFRKAMFSKLYGANTRMEKFKEMYVAKIYMLRIQNVLNCHADGTMLREQKAQVRVEVRTCRNKLLKKYMRVQLISTCVHVDVCTCCNKLLNKYYIQTWQ